MNVFFLCMNFQVILQRLKHTKMLQMKLLVLKMTLYTVTLDNVYLLGQIYTEEILFIDALLCYVS